LTAPVKKASPRADQLVRVEAIGYDKQCTLTENNSI